MSHIHNRKICNIRISSMHLLTKNSNIRFKKCFLCETIKYIWYTLYTPLINIRALTYFWILHNHLTNLISFMNLLCYRTIFYVLHKNSSGSVVPSNPSSTYSIGMSSLPFLSRMYKQDSTSLVWNPSFTSNSAKRLFLRPISAYTNFYWVG